MNTSPRTSKKNHGFTLVEIMFSMTISVLVIGLTLGLFLQCLRIMYYDSVRLDTNANLRKFIAHISKEGLDASEFYLFPSYQTLDGDVSLDTDVSATTTDPYGKTVAHGDCIVLVMRTSSAAEAPIRQFKIYYRVATAAARNDLSPIRFYDSGDVTATGPHITKADLEALLDSVNLSGTPSITGSRLMAEQAKGRLIPASTNSHPIFSSESPTVTPTNESFVINTEIVQGSGTSRMISSSSFNYIITPRR
jgi:prepilin-type N-terminal cleavage/methylation domain-containing protein